MITSNQNIFYNIIGEDDAGNISQILTDHNFTIDRTLPILPRISLGETDNGKSNSDLLTSSNRPVVEFNTEVNLFGLKIKPNDIIHADRHGAVIIPRDALEMLPKPIQFMKDKEDIVIKASKEKDFNFEKLKIAWQKANSMIFRN